MAKPDDPARSQPTNARGPSRKEADRAAIEQLLAAARSGKDVRSRKVRRLKAAIKVRAYENDLKLTVAMERLLAGLGVDVNHSSISGKGRRGPDRAKHR